MSVAKFHLQHSNVHIASDFISLYCTPRYIHKTLDSDNDAKLSAAKWNYNIEQYKHKIQTVRVRACCFVQKQIKCTVLHESARKCLQNNSQIPTILTTAMTKGDNTNVAQTFTFKKYVYLSITVN